MASVDPAIIAKTQEVLGALIKKPSLTEKLLARPPFKYLMDIILAVQKATGFAEGLYDQSEIEGAEKDRETKVAFLKKAIVCVQLTSGENVHVNPLKIVAGQEPDQTNIFLQQLAQAATMPSADAVARVLSGDTAPAPAAKPAPPKKEPAKEPAAAKEPAKDPAAPKPKPKPAPKPKEDEDVPPPQQQAHHSPEKPAHAAADQPPEKPSRPSAAGGSRKKPGESDAPAAAPPEKPTKRPPPLPEKTDAGRPEKPARTHVPPVPIGGGGDGDGPIPLGTYTGSGNDGADGGMDRSRPMTARAAPPKIKSNVRTIEKTDVAAEVVGGAEGKVSGLILDNGANDEEDDDIVVVVDDAQMFAEQAAARNARQQGSAFDVDADRHGGLVNDIMKQKREAEQRLAEQEARNRQQQGRGDDDALFGNQRRNERKAIEAEVSKLREGLQKLTQATQPIGMSMEYIHEDLEAMSREMHDWHDQNMRAKTALTDQRGNMENALVPLQSELIELENKIRDQSAKIRVMKSKVIANDETIHKLLKMVTTTQSS
eukprot:comp21147_c0_seq1/m.44801 comp21147_c0_seq1/g.44801  ORF comp21147_c0_seq1/g.44801 comp21147_c0_seq1/m.44801 type:complete len:541 (+) comp21147_c0_seq1:27-1649(+)